MFLVGRKLPIFMKTPALYVPWLLIWSSPAFAHVKWFAPYDVAEQPRPLTDVFSREFGLLVLAGVVILVAVTWFERTTIAELLTRSVLRFSSPMRARIEDLFRASTAVFFICLFALGGIIMTPELKTDLGAVSWLQAAIAVGLFWRATMPLSAAGIAALYAYGVADYGIFHMLDYPIFLGLAAYLALTSVRVRVFDFRPLDVARWGAAITLMWASVEKWAYPQWTYPLLATHPDLCMGLNSSFYMVAAGFVEFSLAFALLWSPLVRTVAAIILGGMFVAAVFDFGKIDAVGHLMIVIILISIAIDDLPTVRRVALAPVFYCGALAATLTLYYGLHAVLFGTAIW
jgi:hypothetical protein